MNNNKSEGIMKMVMNGISYMLIMGGIVMMAGSAGDCDGACGPGNTIEEMLIIAGCGLAMFLMGSMIVISNQKEG